MADRPRSLDIDDLQVIVEFDGDDEEFKWHHRVALHRLGPGRWVMLTPDFDLEVVDLNTQGYRLLARHANFPRGLANQIYAFDPLHPSDLIRYKKSARTYQALLGDLDLDPDENTIWVVCDTRDEKFGEFVPAALTEGDALTEVGSRGIVEWDNVNRFCELIEVKDKDKTILSWRAADHDCRILPIVRDRGGKRTRTLRDAVSGFTEDVQDDWPHLGPRALGELVRSVAEAVESWTLYHSEWERNSGIATGSSLCHEHRILCESFRLFGAVDQVNLPNLAGAELLARRLIQIEMAVERSARSPDFSGLSSVMAGPTTETGAAVTKNFTEWIASRQKDRAQFLKQDRTLREEQQKERERSGAGAGAGGGGGRGTGAGAAKDGGRGRGRGRGGKGEGKTDGSAAAAGAP